MFYEYLTSKTERVHSTGRLEFFSNDGIHCFFFRLYVFVPLCHKSRVSGAKTCTNKPDTENFCLSTHPETALLFLLKA